jgi:amino acid permease
MLHGATPGQHTTLGCFANIFISFVGAGILGLPFMFRMVSERVPVHLLFLAKRATGSPCQMTSYCKIGACACVRRCVALCAPRPRL